jgi:hypothetical protein
MSDSTLVQAEYAAVRQFFALQNAVARGGVTATQFLSLLDGFSGVFGQVANPNVRAWADRFYQLAAASPTSVGVPVSQVYLVYRFRVFVDTVMNDDGLPFAWNMDWWTAFCYGHRESRPDDDGNPVWYSVDPFRAPAAPPAWQAAITSAFNSWGSTPPSSMVRTGQIYAPDLLPFEDAVLAKWTDQAGLQTTLAPVWRDQATAVQALVQQAAVSPDEYIFLLHVLLTLGAGPADCRTLANAIVNARADSPEYKNDTFINQLVYAMLLRLADPLGPYAFTNAQSQALLQSLVAVVSTTDPVSKAVNTSLANHLKIAQVDVSYPMHDPYNPSVGFMDRQTNALYALDQARAALAAPQ